MSTSHITLPGDRLGSAEASFAGAGAYFTENGNISASIVGIPSSTTTPKQAGSALIPARSTISSVSAISPSETTAQQRLVLPSVGCNVYVRVIRLTQRDVICDIIVVDRPSHTPKGNAQPSAPIESTSVLSVLSHPFRGVLRSIDVRATQKDAVVLADSFRIGDIVRARVISLGDQGGYYLTTAGNEFGVVMSWSDSGNVCVPVSWKEVQDVVTGAGEGRKVAKPV